MPHPSRRCFGIFLIVALVYIILTGIAVHATKGTNAAELRENAKWVKTSKSWLDRQVCNWFGLCGLAHLSSEGWASGSESDNETNQVEDFGAFWTSSLEDPASWSEGEVNSRSIPQYVFDHAPYVHLFSREEFWPSDIAEHLVHTTPKVNYTTILERANDRNLTNLHELNDIEHAKSGKFVYLHSDDNPEDYPDWLTSRHNIPSAPGHRQTDTYRKSSTVQYKTELRRRRRELRDEKSKPDPFGRSNAPAILIVVDKGDGVVDAFWFFFYSFNLGQKVFNIRFGNHVGDWEHTVIRFKDGKPELIFLSEHDFGEANTWSVIEKYAQNARGSPAVDSTSTEPSLQSVAERPVVYSAVGSHATYATPGRHPYILPFGLLHDDTDRGPLWDPALNVQSYTYDIHTKQVRASTRNPQSPTGWFDYAGHWGDKYYPLSDPRQYRIAGQYHYVNGPTGPKFKNLGREAICQGKGPCHVKHHGEPEKPHGKPAEEDVEVGGLPGGNVTDDLQ